MALAKPFSRGCTAGFGGARGAVRQRHQRPARQRDPIQRRWQQPSYLLLGQVQQWPIPIPPVTALTLHRAARGQAFRNGPSVAGGSALAAHVLCRGRRPGSRRRGGRWPAGGRSRHGLGAHRAAGREPAGSGSRWAGRCSRWPRRGSGCEGSTSSARAIEISCRSPADSPAPPSWTRVIEPALQPTRRPRSNADRRRRLGPPSWSVASGRAEADAYGDRAREQEQVIQHHAQLASVASKLARLAGRCRPPARLPPHGS